jgi:hypothetical protein
MAVYPQYRAEISGVMRFLKAAKNPFEARDHIRTLRTQCEAITERIEDLLLIDACRKLTTRRG